MSQRAQKVDAIIFISLNKTTKILIRFFLSSFLPCHFIPKEENKIEIFVLYNFATVPIWQFTPTETMARGWQLHVVRRKLRLSFDGVWHEQLMRRKALKQKTKRKMADADDSIELLFFDTFSHEIHEVIAICSIHRCANSMLNTISVKCLTAFCVHFDWSNIWVSCFRPNA